MVGENQTHVPERPSDLPDDAHWLCPRRITLSAALLLLWLQAVFTLISLGASLVPSNRVEAELLASVRNDGLGKTDYSLGPTGSVIDHYEDCLSLSEGLAPTPGMNVLQTALFNSTTFENGWVKECDSMIRLVSHQPVSSTGYVRFWHGAGALSRPVVALGGVEGLRVTLTVLLWGSLALTGFMVARAASVPASVLLLAPFVLTTGFPDLPQSVLDALVTIAMLFGMAVLAAITRRTRGDPSWILLTALAVGSVYNFVDMVRNPPGAWAFSVATVALVAASLGLRRRRLANAALAATGGWILGYAGSWVGKWVISATFLGPTSVWREVSNEFLYYGNGGSTHASSVRALELTVGRWTRQPLMPIPAFCVLVAIVVVGLGFVAWRAGWVGLPDQLIMVASSLLVPAWFLAIHQATAESTLWAYRSVPMAAGVALAGVFAGSHLLARPTRC
jgi:hypothetical protein